MDVGDSDDVTLTVNEEEDDLGSMGEEEASPPNSQDEKELMQVSPSDSQNAPEVVAAPEGSTTETAL